jgi:hypothetical protein
MMRTGSALAFAIDVVSEATHGNDTRMPRGKRELTLQAFWQGTIVCVHNRDPRCSGSFDRPIAPAGGS